MTRLLRTAKALSQAGSIGRPLFWLELVLVFNLAMVGVDILFAHAINAFAHPGEWIPVAFSAAGTVIVLAARAIGGPLPVPASRQAGSPAAALARLLGLLVGWGAIGVGIVGMIFHLRSGFFVDQTLQSLVYAAPFSAPLAYVGLGLLLILNRTVEAHTREWAGWVILLALGGFVGNFALSLTDHAINGFHDPAEWTGVIAGAVGIGVLAGALAAPEHRPTHGLAVVAMVGQIAVGLVGTALHVSANLRAPGATLVEKFLYGAPAFAPMLFADIALIGLIGLWALARTVSPPVPVSISTGSVPVPHPQVS
jgi:hypothetical protein